MARRKTHPGNIEERGSSLRVRLMVDGEMHRYTLNGATKKDAREFLREKKQELEEQAERRATGLPGQVSVAELFEEFKEQHLPTLAPRTQESYKLSLRTLETFFAEELDDPNLDAIRPGHVRQFLQWRRVHGPDGQDRSDNPLSNRTLQKDRAILHKAFELATSSEYVDRNPVSAVEAPKPEGRDPVILSDEQYENLLSECEHNDMLYLYVLTMGETGARSRSEVLHLRWDDVDLDDGFIWIGSSDEGRRTKSGEGRYVPMTKRLHRAMAEHFQEYRFATYDGETTEWLFHHRTAKRANSAGNRIQSMKKSFGNACERAELPERFTQHDLRHRRVTKWLAETKNPVHIKEAVGHSNLSTTMGYSHLAKEHLRSLVEPDEGEESENLTQGNAGA